MMGIIEIEAPTLPFFQSQILDSQKRFTVTEAATKTGKTFCHIWWIFKEAHKPKYKAGNEFWWVAPVYGQAKIAFKRMHRKVAASPYYKVNQSNLTITTPLETVIAFHSADKPDSLYGEDVYAAVFDEFTRAKKESWFALRSTLTATNGKCKLIGNYTGLANWGHQLASKASDTGSEYQYFKVTAWDAVKAGILKEAEILQAQKDLPKNIFKKLYLAEDDGDHAQLITNEHIIDLFTNDHVAEGDKYITADIALHGSDRFVLGVWSGFILIDLVVIDKCDATEVERVIKETAKKHSVQRSHIAYDADGLGTFLQGYLKGAVPFHNGSAPIKEAGQAVDYRNLKSQCYFIFAKRADSGGYWIDSEAADDYRDKITEDLQAIKERIKGSENKVEIINKDEVKEIIGRSPDFSDMLMMREVFELKGARVTALVM